MDRIDNLKKGLKIISSFVLYTRVRYAVLVLMLVLAAYSVRFFIGSYVGDENVIAEAFSDTDVIDNDSILELTAYYGDTFLSENDKTELVKYIAGRLGIHIDTDVKYEKSDERTVTEYVKKAKRAETVIRLVSLNTKDNIAEHYLLIRLSVADDIEYDILEYRDKFTDVLKEMDVEELYTTVQLNGLIKGKTDIVTMDSYSDSMLKNLGGQIVYENRQAENYVIYAYSAAFPEYIELQESMINIQIMMKYDTENDCTRIQLATPICK